MTKTFKDVKGIEEACWVGYKQVGMKKKGNRQVPNCVKEEIVYAVFGKDYVYKEPVTEAGVEDMYKGKLNKDQLNTIKNTWKNKKLSDVTQGVKDMIRGYDAFTRMDIKQANIKYLSDLINDEVQHEEIEMVDTLTNMVEDNELRASVRKSEELKEFSTDQISRLAKSYAGLAGKTMSVDNANKLRKIFDKIPDSSLNALRKKKIPFISGLALSRMIQKKIPVTESAWEISGVENEGREELREVKERVPRKGDSFVNYRNKGDISQVTRQRHFANSKEADAFKKKVKDMGGKVVHSGVIQNEADLSKSQIKKVHKQADDLPKKDFIKRYGKDGDSVRYATATNMVKKKLGLGESNFIKKGELKMNDTYKQRLTSAMEHFSISSLGELNEDDHKTFFAYVDDMKEGLSAAQKKLPPALQKAIAAKMKDKKEVKEDLVGGQKKLDKDKDGDLDAKDFAMLRKKEGSMKKEYGMSGNMMASKKKMKEEKTKETDSEPKMKDLNAMVKSSHKPDHKGKPIDDMNAGYMKSNVKAPVKDNGGADMAAVKDKPTMGDPMKKINAMYSELNQVADAYTNMSASKNKMNKETHAKYLKTKPGSLEEAVLKSRGLIK